MVDYLCAGLVCISDLAIHLQAQNELVTVKRDLSPLRKSSSSVKELLQLEEERDLVKSDLRRVQEESESLRDRLKVNILRFYFKSYKDGDNMEALINLKVQSV